MKRLVLKNDEKRIISVGLLEPKVLKGDVIYVDLRRDHACRSPKGVRAVAYSNEEFRYEERPLNENEVRMAPEFDGRHYIENMSLSETLGYNKFIRMLSNNNNATPGWDRFFSDSIYASDILKRMEHMSDEIRNPPKPEQFVIK